VITFHQRDACQRSQLLPVCATTVKCYNSRLVIDTETCDLSHTNMSVWINSVFGETTIALLEEDSMVAHNSNPPVKLNISVESAIWDDRWWPMSGPSSMRATEMWKFTNASSETIVAILDSGLARLATPLFANIAEGYDFISDPDISNDGDGRDTNWEDPGNAPLACAVPDSWHGTQVASIVAAQVHEYRGVATNATIMPIRVLGACGNGYASDVADAIVWASGGTINNIASNPVPVTIISMSLSGLGPCASYIQSAVNQVSTITTHYSCHNITHNKHMT
jgi:serine protease